MHNKCVTISGGLIDFLTPAFCNVEVGDQVQFHYFIALRSLPSTPPMLTAT